MAYVYLLYFIIWSSPFAEEQLPRQWLLFCSDIKQDLGNLIPVTYNKHFTPTHHFTNKYTRGYKIQTSMKF